MTTWRRLVAGVAGLGMAAGVLVVGSAVPAGATSAGVSGTATPAAPAVTSGAQGFHAMAPVRVLDTRTGLGASKAPVGSGRSIDVQLTGVPEIPATGVAAVVFNLTAVSPTTAGFLTVYPTGTARPTASTINFTPHQTIANEVIATIGTSGKVTIFNSSGSTQVLADISGWFTTNSYYTPLVPTRVLDTRTGLGAPKTPVGPGQSIDVQISGLAGIPATGATAVAVNITATAPTAQTYITAYPTGDARPGTSNLNLVAGQTTAVLAVTKLGTDGRISLYNNSGNTQLIADITGWFTTTGQFTPITPNRVLDTRKTGGPIVSGQKIVSLADSATIGSIPADADSVILSVTAVNPAVDSYLTVYPTGTTRPPTSNLNFTAGQTVANLVITKIGVGSSISVFLNSGHTHLLVDVLGWFVTPLDFAPVTLPDAALPGSYSHSMSATGGVAPYNWTVNSGALPAGLTLASTGPRTATIAGTPTTTGTSTFTIRVTDAIGVSLEQTITLTVQPFVSRAVWAWGAGTQGELGNGFSETSGTPVRVSGLSDVTDIAGGTNTGYALKEDGTVWAWGANSEGALGDGTTTDRNTPVQVTGLTGVTAIAAGFQAGYALKADGTVWAWGANDNGALGDGTIARRLTPVQVPGLTGITAIAGGFDSASALASDGTVWAWGAIFGNTDGDTPRQVLRLTGVTAIAGGLRVGYALKSDGTVWAWGFGAEGELGNGTNNNSGIPVQVTGLTGVTTINAAFRSGYALKSDGTVWGWGDNRDGELGDGTTVNRNTPVQVTGLTGVTTISAGYFTGYALRSDGTVWGWGDGGGGALGTGNITTTTVPVQIAGMPPVTALAAGSLIAYALGTS